MRRSTALLLLLALLACALSGCGQRDQVPEEAPPPVEQGPEGGENAQPETLEAFLADLKGTEIAHVDWLIDIENKPSAQEVAALLNAAAAHTVDRSGEIDAIWSLFIYLDGSDAEGYSSDDGLCLSAGLEENLVEIFGGVDLPGGRIWVEDEPLYQLVRTMMDTPDGEIDQAAYARYQTEVDGYLADLPEFYSTVDAGIHRELTRFSLKAESQRLNAQVYVIGCVCIVEPPEKAPQLLAGGAFVDSRMRVHEDGSSVNDLLVAVDGRAVGFTWWENLEYGSLDQFADKEELIEAVQSGKSWF